MKATQTTRQCFTSEVVQAAREDGQGVCCEKKQDDEKCPRMMEEGLCRTYLESLGFKSCFYEVPLNSTGSENWDSYPCAPPEVQFEFPAFSFDVFSAGLVALELYCGLQASDELGVRMHREGDAALDGSKCLATVPESIRGVVRNMVRAWPGSRAAPELGAMSVERAIGNGHTAAFDFESGRARNKTHPGTCGNEGIAETTIQVDVVLEQYTSRKFPGAKFQTTVDTLETCVTGCGSNAVYTGEAFVGGHGVKAQCGVTEDVFLANMNATLSSMDK
eukprot:TRINITY_DN69037_c0_g1_i1.p1 TRINITY_DN69037_c0_g1~~TRINITY_DN69037_c0_g1_i1.p1  ORF type:complete len:276 (-),score=44.17 TRINITY_DN69037_c0_g1_i1:50-877(-)